MVVVNTYTNMYIYICIYIHWIYPPSSDCDKYKVYRGIPYYKLNSFGADCGSVYPIYTCIEWTWVWMCNWSSVKGIASSLAGATVDGSEIRQTHQLRLVVYPILYDGFFTAQVVIAGFLNHQQYQTPFLV